jgi:UDP-N-acetylmuramoyl-tripeptide--D-alanyl-D-alanine ligase
VRKGKGELFDFLRENEGTAFIMKDYEYLREMSKGIPEVITYGTKDAEVTGIAAETDRYLEVSFQKGFHGTIATQLVGDYNLPNVLAAVSVGKKFGITDTKIKQAIENYEPTNSRSQFMQRDSNKIILDAYNANPSSMKAAIKNFAKAGGENKILILGAMAELGNESANEHKDIIQEIKKYDWNNVILVGGDFLKLDHPFHRFNSSSEAGNWLKDTKPSNAFLLIKGSRSMQMEKVLDYL